MLRITEIKEAYNKVKVSDRKKVIKDLAEHFGISEGAIRNHYISNDRIPKNAYETQARKDIIKIIKKYC